MINGESLSADNPVPCEWHTSIVARKTPALFPDAGTVMATGDRMEIRRQIMTSIVPVFIDVYFTSARNSCQLET